MGLFASAVMGISRSSQHKRRLTGGKKTIPFKKRKHALGRPMAGTRIGQKRIRTVRGRGANIKFRALRLDSGNFSWGSEAQTRKCRIIDVVYNATNNELLRTKTLVKNAIVQVDATPFRQWYESHYGVKLGKKERTKEEKKDFNACSKSVKDKHAKRQETRVISPILENQFDSGRLYAAIASRPGQSGRADGYVLEGRELEFYMRKMIKKKKA